jgi:hypothetical protein
MTDQSEVNPYGMFFEGDGVSVEMATFTAKNTDDLHDVILKITGHAAAQAGIDGKAIKYSAVPAGTGTNFTFEKDGETRTRMVTRQSWGSWSFFEVFLNGETFKVYKNNDKSKEVAPLHLLTAAKK